MIRQRAIDAYAASLKPSRRDVFVSALTEDAKKNLAARAIKEQAAAEHAEAEAKAGKKLEELERRGRGE